MLFSSVSFFMSFIFIFFYISILLVILCIFFCILFQIVSFFMSLKPLPLCCILFFLLSPLCVLLGRDLVVSVVVVSCPLLVRSQLSVNIKRKWTPYQLGSRHDELGKWRQGNSGRHYTKWCSWHCQQCHCSLSPAVFVVVGGGCGVNIHTHTYTPSPFMSTGWWEWVREPAWRRWRYRLWGQARTGRGRPRRLYGVYVCFWCDSIVLRLFIFVLIVCHFMCTYMNSLSFLCILIRVISHI